MSLLPFTIYCQILSLLGCLKLLFCQEDLNTLGRIMLGVRIVDFKPEKTNYVHDDHAQGNPNLILQINLIPILNLQEIVDEDIGNSKVKCKLFDKLREIRWNLNKLKLTEEEQLAVMASQKYRVNYVHENSKLLLDTFDILDEQLIIKNEKGYDYDLNLQSQRLMINRNKPKPKVFHEWLVGGWDIEGMDLIDLRDIVVQRCGRTMAMLYNLFEREIIDLPDAQYIDRKYIQVMEELIYVLRIFQPIGFSLNDYKTGNREDILFADSFHYRREKRIKSDMAEYTPKRKLELFASDSKRQEICTGDIQRRRAQDHVYNWKHPKGTSRSRYDFFYVYAGN